MPKPQKDSCWLCTVVRLLKVKLTEVWWPFYDCDPLEFLTFKPFHTQPAPIFPNNDSVIPPVFRLQQFQQISASQGTDLSVHIWGWHYALMGSRKIVDFQGFFFKLFLVVRVEIVASKLFRYHNWTLKSSCLFLNYGHQWNHQRTDYREISYKVSETSIFRNQTQ